MSYHVPGFTLADLRNTDSRELEWFYSRLIKQLRDDEEEFSDKQRGLPS